MSSASAVSYSSSNTCGLIVEPRSITGPEPRLPGDPRAIADAHQVARLVAVPGADVDVQVLHVGDLLAIVLLEQVDRLLADHARQMAVAGDHLDPLADEDLPVPAADAR